MPQSKTPADIAQEQAVEAALSEEHRLKKKAAAAAAADEAAAGPSMLLSMKPDAYDIALALYKEKFAHPTTGEYTSPYCAPQRTKNSKGEDVLAVSFSSKSEAETYFKALAEKGIAFMVTDKQGNELYQSLGNGGLQKKVGNTWQPIEASTHHYRTKMKEGVPPAAEPTAAPGPAFGAKK